MTLSEPRNLQQILADRRDGLLHEAEYLEKRLIHVREQIIEINMRIAPRWPE